MQFESTGNVSEEELNALLTEELTRRAAGNIGMAGVPVVANAGRTAIHKALNDALTEEFEDIRSNPELRKKQYDQMVRTYDNYLSQGNNPVEVFIPNDKNIWAAGQTEDGQDVVYFDPGAPHAAVMAHELGHVQMNHSNDPLSYLQTSGIGRASQNLAPALGMAGAIGGYAARPKRRLAGAALGTGIGALLGSGNFAYELGGASGRALGYLPEDVDKVDAAGDLLKAGMTYGMAGPGAAIASGASVAGIMELARRLNRG